MRIALVILNWNTAGYLRRWLPSLLKSCEGIDAGVVVADNCSSDGSVDMLSSEFPEVLTIRFEDNYGFTGGYNRAMSLLPDLAGNPEYAVLVNSDIDVPQGWLQPLVRWMDSHPECGVCGPKLHAMGPDFTRTDRFEYAGAAGGLLDRYGFPFCRGRVLSRTEVDKGQYDSPADVLWVSGACMMTRMSLWRELGGLDERFFAHMEEIDYCWRMRLSGYSVTIVPDSTVWHLGGGTLPQGSPFKLKLNYRNNLLLLDNNLSSSIGEGKAVRRIMLRRFLDLLAAAAYLLTGKTKCFRSVMSAHKEYRSLKKKRGSRVLMQVYPVTGLSPYPVVALSLVMRGRIFDFLEKHENSYRRGR